MRPPPVVLITGGSRGLGAALAHRFGAGGYRVGVNYREHGADADATARSIAAVGGEALPLVGDVRHPDEIRAVAQAVLDRWGRLDVFVHNAGVTRDRLVTRMRADDWDDVIATHLTGAFHGLRAVAPAMTAAGGGQILMLLSVAGQQGRAGQANYAAAKAGLVGLIRSAAREWGRDNVRVNGIIPGVVVTDMTRRLTPQAAAALYTGSVLGRGTSCAEVAEISFALAATANISGQIFQLDSHLP